MFWEWSWTKAVGLGALAFLGVRYCVFFVKPDEAAIVFDQRVGVSGGVRRQVKHPFSITFLWCIHKRKKRLFLISFSPPFPCPLKGVHLNLPIVQYPIFFEISPKVWNFTTEGQCGQSTYLRIG